MSVVPIKECSSCTPSSLAIINLKRWHAITIGCCCLLGFSGLSLSAYLLCKYLKLKRTVNSLQARIQSLAEQINDSLRLEPSSSKKLKRIPLRSIPSNKKVVSVDESSSSSVDEDDAYETPDEPMSPVQKTAKFVQFAEARPGTNGFDLNLNDNRSLELMQMQTYEDKKLICSNNRNKYENDPSDLNNNVNFIKSLYVMSDFEDDLETKKSLQFEAHEVAKKCAMLFSDSYLAHKWYALTVGKIVDYMSINDKIKSGFEFKDRLDKAISLNQSDYMLFYLRGRWFFKMCNLTWPEKYGIRVLFGKIPEITLEDAYLDFLKVEELHKSKSKGNTLHLAKCLIHKKEIEKAVEYLKISYELPIRTSEHLKDNEEILTLLSKYS